MTMTKEQYISKKKKEFEAETEKFESWIKSFDEKPKEYVSYALKPYIDCDPYDVKRLSCPQCRSHFFYRGRKYGIYVCSVCFCEVGKTNGIYIVELN